MSRHWVLGILALLQGIGCGEFRAPAGSPCTLDSDCTAGLWCDAATATCVAPSCADGLCELEDEYSTSSGTAQSSEGPTLETLQQRVEDLEKQLASGGGGTSENCNPYSDPEGTFLRVNTFTIGVAGLPGEGFNLDNEDTCAPPESEGANIPACQEGIDNAIAGIAKLINPILAENVPPVSLVYSPTCGQLLFPEETSDAEEFSPVAPAGTLYLENINWTPSSFDAEGGEWVVLIPLPFGGGSILRVRVSDVRVTGEWDAEAEEWTAMVGGWASRAALEAALSTYTADDLDGTPPETALSIVMQLADRDENGDGTLDSVSLGIRFTAKSIEAETP